MPRIPLMSLAALAAATLPAAASATDAASRSPEVPVIVTASREAEPAFDALASVIVIDRADIERSLAPDVADLLRFHAGLDVGRVGGPGQTTSLFIRGTNSNHAVVMVDGVRINPGTLGGAALQNIAPELVDHIEIVKGPRSTLYGTDAIGGVVNVITRRPEGSHLQALVGYGRYDTREGSVSGQYGDRTAAGSVAVNWLDSAGLPTRSDDSVARGYRNLSVALAGRAEIGGAEVGARLWRASGNTQYSDFFLTPVDQDFQNSSFALDAGGQVTARWHTRVTASRIVDDIRQAQSPDYALTRRNAIDWQNGVALGAQQLTFGALLTREHTRAESFGTGFDVDTRSDTWYAEDRVTLGRHRLLAAVGYTHHETFGDHSTWNLEYGYAPRAGTLLTASAGTAFRAPDSTDRFGFGGNPALRPESSRNVELGVRQHIGARQTLTLAAFDDRIDELVQFVTLSFDPFAGQNRNVDRARIRGLEASWDWIGDEWRARAEASRQDPVNRADGTRLLRRSRTSATLALSRRYGRQEAGLDLLTVGDREDFGFPDNVRLGGYTLLNVGWRLQLPAGFNLQVRLENALDKRYELASGYNTMRRSVFGALRYDFR